MKQPNVSNHLARLKSKGIVRSNKVGRMVYYSLSSAEVAEALAGILAPEESPLTELELGPELVRQFSKAATQGDEFTCNRIVDTLVRQQVPTVQVYQSLFGESMLLIGRWWEVQAIDVGQEHLASAIIERLMARILHFAAPPKPGALRCVLGCSPGNWHSIGLRMLADIMRLSGWQTFYLGANVPIESFLSSVREHQPYVALVSCPIDTLAPACLELIETLQREKEERPSFLIGAGGKYVNENPGPFLAAGADFTSTNLLDFTERILPMLESRQHEFDGSLN
jgi:methanogenic corrinoid protein MtbC1